MSILHVIMWTAFAMKNNYLFFSWQNSFIKHRQNFIFSSSRTSRFILRSARQCKLVRRYSSQWRHNEKSVTNILRIFHKIYSCGDVCNRKYFVTKISQRQNNGRLPFWSSGRERRDLFFVVRDVPNVNLLRFILHGDVIMKKL